MTASMDAPAPHAPTPESAVRVRGLLAEWLADRLPGDAAAALRERCAAMPGASPHRFQREFSAAWRLAPDRPLAPGDGALAAATAARPRWDPSRWTVRGAARVLLLLHRDSTDGDRWCAELDALFGGADLAEAETLYGALPVLPHPDRLVARCAEGVRTNLTRVFRAVAHGNPFPAERLPEPAWNQMVLKALFVEVPLAPVTGLDARANPALARMLVDYARERRAAGRPVSPELWRCVGPHADADGVAELRRALRDGPPEESAAAGAALRACPHPAAAAVLEEVRP